LVQADESAVAAAARPPVAPVAAGKTLAISASNCPCSPKSLCAKIQFKENYSIKYNYNNNYVYIFPKEKKKKNIHVMCKGGYKKI
jgi:hypothetical protein